MAPLPPLSLDEADRILDEPNAFARLLGYLGLEAATALLLSTGSR